jgi:tetratricopeptide (TPR) repeat protein
MKSPILKKTLFLATITAVIISNSLNAQDLTSAILLTKSEQYDKAETIYKQLIQKEPANAKNYFFLGENYLLTFFADTISNSLAEFTGLAKEVFQKGVGANPNDPLNYVGLAKVATYLGDDNTAADMRAKAKSFLLPYKNIKKISPPAKDYAFALAKIAESYIKYNQVDTASALPLIRQAVKIDSKNADIYLIAGDIYITIPDGSAAIKNYNLAQFADPKSPTANMKIGYIYAKGRALPQAIQRFEEAIELDPNYAPAYRELGQVYWSANRLEQSKENFKKYLGLNEGNIPAKTRYVNSLFYAGDYDEVIKNVEEILAIDRSRSYMNRLAGYSSYEKKNADLVKAQSYMEELFRTVSPERILWKDHFYLARILMKKHQEYPKSVDELNSLTQQLDKERARFNSVSAAEKAKLKPALDNLTERVSKLKTEVANADKELDKGFAEYNSVLKLRPMDKGILSEMSSYYYNYRRYNMAAKTFALLIDPAKDDPDAYMRVGRTFYNGENYKAADSVFNVILKKDPAYLPAHVQIARTYSKMDPDTKLGIARPKFEKVAEIAKADSVKYSSELVEALDFLGYFHMDRGNFSTSKNYYNRMINLDPDNRENKIRGYNGIGAIELRMAGAEKTNEGRLPFLARSADAYTRILALDPNNASAKAQLSYLRDFEASVKKGINPNEIKGIIKDAATGAPIPYVSIRVKDTAAENMTNTKGEYKFEIPQGSEILVITAKGYQTQEIPITKLRVYNISLSK